MSLIERNSIDHAAITANAELPIHATLKIEENAQGAYSTKAKLAMVAVSIAFGLACYKAMDYFGPDREITVKFHELLNEGHVLNDDRRILKAYAFAQESCLGKDSRACQNLITSAYHKSIEEDKALGRYRVIAFHLANACVEYDNNACNYIVDNELKELSKNNHDSNQENLESMNRRIRSVKNFKNRRV